MSVISDNVRNNFKKSDDNRDKVVPAAIALNCGAFKIEVKPNDSEDLTALLMADFLQEGGSEKELIMINSLNYITESFPPVFFMTSEGDFMKYQAKFLAEKLSEQNVPFIYRYYKNPKQELPHVFHCNIRSKDAQRCNDEECYFFREIYEAKRENQAESPF